MSEVYIVAWTGEYETPSYTATRTLKEARQWADKWAADASEDDTIDVLRLDLTTMTLTRA